MPGRTYIGAIRCKKLYLGSTKIKKVYQGTDQVYSSGSLVSYYNGSTLLGTREFEEGQSVLSPTGISPTKSGYTFKGWAYTDGASFDNRITSLVANGNPITLYAVFIPSTLVIFSMATSENSAVGGGLEPTGPTINNTRYITAMMNDGMVGRTGASVWYRQGSSDGSGTVMLNLRGEYSRAEVLFRISGFNASDGRWISNNLGQNSRTSSFPATATRTSTSQTPSWTITSNAEMNAENTHSFVWTRTWVQKITLYTS